MTVTCFVSVLPPPYNLRVYIVIGPPEYYFDLTWRQEGVYDECIIYWRVENGPKYNISTDSLQNELFVDDNLVEFTFYDTRITSATWYYISVVAVFGEETSNSSETLRVRSGEFNGVIKKTSIAEVCHFCERN